jgi:hypothetical protein
MIKKFIFTVVPLGLILVACEAQQDFVPKECVVVDPPGMCANAPAIMIHTNTHIVAPPNYCASPGENIQVNVKPVGGEVGTVVTSPKTDIPENAWLNGGNESDPNGFELIAPPDAEGKYDYKVVFSDGYCIDPRISVQESVAPDE